MRISDWSSDVCSSDLAPAAVRAGHGAVDAGAAGRKRLGEPDLDARAERLEAGAALAGGVAVDALDVGDRPLDGEAECRRIRLPPAPVAGQPGAPRQRPERTAGAADTGGAGRVSQ